VTLLPGLIDMHVHLTSSPLFAGYNSLLFTDSFWAVISTNHAKATLERGVSPRCAMSARTSTTTSAAPGVENGFVEGPRIVTATYAIGSTARALRLDVLSTVDGAEEPGSDRHPRGRQEHGPRAAVPARRADRVGAVTIRGPSTKPFSTPWRSPTSLYSCEPTLRTVVNPRRASPSRGWSSDAQNESVNSSEL